MLSVRMFLKGMLVSESKCEMENEKLELYKRSRKKCVSE